MLPVTPPCDPTACHSRWPLFCLPLCLSRSQSSWASRQLYSSDPLCWAPTANQHQNIMARKYQNISRARSTCVWKAYECTSTPLQLGFKHCICIPLYELNNFTLVLDAVSEALGIGGKWFWYVWKTIRTRLKKEDWLFLVELRGNFLYVPFFHKCP